MRRALCAVVVVALSFLPFSPVSCSTEQLERLDSTTRPETTAEPTSGLAHEVTTTPQPEPEGYLVPVTHLTSTLENVRVEKLAQYRELAIPRGFRKRLDQLLGSPDLRLFDSAAAVVEHVSRSPEAIGLVPWEEVDPRVKVLAVDDRALLEADPPDLEGYPLKLEPAGAPDPELLRRVVVAGDVVLDRGLPYEVFHQARGLDFPLGGGRAAITWRTPEPSPYSEFGVIHHFGAERRGETGKMREYLSGADLTLANFENPVLRDAVWHPEATTFTGDLRLLPVLGQAGIDGVTLANNHVLDAGIPGLRETLRHLADAGISHAGAGMDLAAAREPMIFKLGRTEVGVLSYQGVPSYEWAWATEETAGTAPLRSDVMREDIKRLRSEVDLIVVMPHWGKEYTATPEPDQIKLAHAAIDAGADLVVGSHAHWAKGIELYKGRPIFYGTGNFLFDQDWSDETSTGIFAEFVLYGDRVVQARPVPFVILDHAQPNFLAPEAGGNRALNTIFSTSAGPAFEAHGEPTTR